MTVIKKVLANNVQALTDAEKAQARNNIGANRVVFVTYGVSTQAEIGSAVSNGDSVILQVPFSGSAAYVPLSYASSAGFVFRSPVSSSGKFTEYAVNGTSWTPVNKTVLTNNAQSLSAQEQAQVRSNIDASKVGIRQAVALSGTTSTELQTLSVDPGPVTQVTKKSLLLISVYTDMTLKDTSTPADLTMSVQLAPAIKIGGSDGDESLQNTSYSYSKTSATSLHKFSSFMAVLDAGQSVTHTYTFQSTVAGFTVSYAINQNIVELE